MSYFVHILKYKFLSYLKTLLEIRVVNIIKHVSSLVVFGGFAVGAFIFANQVTKYVLEDARLGLFLLHRFLEMLLFVFFISVHVGNIIVSYASLYRSDETMFYLTKPVPESVIIGIKFLDTFFYSSATLFLIAIAVLLGYGAYFDFPWYLYILCLLFFFLPFMFLSASSAVILLIVIVKLSKRYNVRGLVAGLGLLYILSIYLYFSITNPAKLVTSVMRYYPNVDQYFGFLDPFISNFLPNHWIGESLYWIHRGEYFTVGYYIGILLITSFLTILLMIAIGKKYYFTSWLSYLELKARSKFRSVQGQFFSLLNPIRIAVQSNVIMRKEYWQFFREPSQWIHLAIIGVLVLIFVVSVSNISLKPSGFPFEESISYLIVYVFNVFLVSSIALRFVYPMISIEGRSFWKILSAPISRSKIFGVKFFVVLIPVIIIAEVLVFGSHYSLLDFPSLVGSAVVGIFFAACALISLNLGMGALYVDYKESNPIRAASSHGAILTFLISLIYLIFLVAVKFYPVLGVFTEANQKVISINFNFIHALTIIVILSVCIALGFYLIGLKSLERDY